MSSMKDREEGFERKFAFDEELRFKAAARRNKALGLWAAEKLGKFGAEAEAYAKKHGIDYRVQEPKEAKRRTISYSDNFRYDRKVPWTH